MKKRLFIAIKINNSNSFLNVQEEIKLSLQRERIKWIDPDNLHLTLSFLGDTDELIIPKLKLAMDSIVGNFSQFNMELKSVGVFKSINFPTVLWIGIEPNKIMSEIKKALDLQLKSIGIAVEMREFKPHLTIGRIKNITDKKNLELLLKNYSNKKISNQLVNEIILYESILSSDGPIYNVIYKSLIN